MHLPELAVRSRRLSGFCGKLGMRMHRREREVAKDKAQSISESLLQFFHDGIGLTAIRAFVIAVFHEGDRGGCWTLNVIAFPHRERQPGYPLCSHAVTSGLVGSASRAARIPSAPGLTPTGET